jgi:hypothetical protein
MLSNTAKWQEDFSLLFELEQMSPTRLILDKAVGLALIPMLAKTLEEKCAPRAQGKSINWRMVIGPMHRSGDFGYGKESLARCLPFGYVREQP